MIAFLNEYGYPIMFFELLLSFAVVLYHRNRKVTKEDNDVILASVSKRSESFLMNRTESKWGTGD